MKKIIAVLTFIIGMQLSAASVKAINFDPGDYYALPPGTNLAILYSGYLGDVGDTDAELNASINILRLVWYREFMGMTVDPQILLPFGAQDLDNTPFGDHSTTGLADPILAATFWVHNTKESQIGITPFLFLPLGDYDNDELLNFGENRTKFALQVGFVRQVTPKLLMEFAADFQIHGDNTDFGPTSSTLEQDTSYEFRLSGKYSVSNKLSLGLQGAYQIVGEQKVDGALFAEENKIFSLSGYAQYMLQPDLQLQFKYDRQLDIDNEGLVGRTQNAELRLVKIY